MGTQIANKNLKIKFTVPDILQESLEVYERVLGEYIEESGTNGEVDTFVVSAVIFGAIEAGWIPESVIAKNEVLDASPKKLIFISKEILQLYVAKKIVPDDYKLDFVVPEITQGMLEDYELKKREIIGDHKITSYESAWSFHKMVEIGIALGWVSESLLKEEEIAGSDPVKIVCIANRITEALTDCKNVSGE